MPWMPLKVNLKSVSHLSLDIGERVHLTDHIPTRHGSALLVDNRRFESFDILFSATEMAAGP